MASYEGRNNIKNKVLNFLKDLESESLQRAISEILKDPNKFEEDVLLDTTYLKAKEPEKTDTKMNYRTALKANYGKRRRARVGESETAIDPRARTLAAKDDFQHPLFKELLGSRPAQESTVTRTFVKPLPKKEVPIIFGLCRLDGAKLAIIKKIINDKKLDLNRSERLLNSAPIGKKPIFEKQVERLRQESVMLKTLFCLQPLKTINEILPNLEAKTLLEDIALLCPPKIGAETYLLLENYLSKHPEIESERIFMLLNKLNMDEIASTVSRLQTETFEAVEASSKVSGTTPAIHKHAPGRPHLTSPMGASHSTPPLGLTFGAGLGEEGPVAHCAGNPSLANA